MINIPKQNPNLEYYLECADPKALRLDDLDYAIVGTTQDGLFVYDYDRVIDIFIKEHGMELDEAIEWVDHHVLGRHEGNGFIIIYSEEKYHE